MGKSQITNAKYQRNPKGQRRPKLEHANLLAFGVWPLGFARGHALQFARMAKFQKNSIDSRA
jgi:hypothetical protein